MTTRDSVLQMAVSARTIGDVNALEAALRRRLVEPRVRYLGDKEANWAEISSPADPTALLFERVTNMWDALIELHARRTGLGDWTTPAIAAADFLGAAGIGDLTDSERDRFARDAVITLHDSDDPKLRPTLSFRDHGIGLGASEMPDTILSLAGSNKLRKPYLHGLFGKGGSSACVFSDATVIVSRKQPDLLGAGEEDLVTVAVVREDDAADMGLPFYRYWVGADNLPLAAPAAASGEFAPGTLVIHVNYQAGKMGVQQWRSEDSIYTYAETLLFKPTLPYSLHDDRSDKFNARPVSRRKPSTLSGLAQRLENTRTDGLIQQSRWSTVAVPGVGEARLRWWLFEEPDQRRLRAAKGYVVLFTTNGQVHHAWDQARLQLQVGGLRRVSQRIIAEVDCDGVDLKKRAKLFDAFRNQVRKGPEGKALEAAVADELAGDPDLEERESEFNRRALRTAGQRVSEAFLRRLNNAVRARLGGVAGAPAPGEQGQRRPRPKKAVELHPEPTSFNGPAQVTVLTGARASIYMSCNAVDGFVPEKGAVQVDSEVDIPELAFGLGDLRRGRLRISVVAALDAQPDIYPVEIVLEWPRSAGGIGRMTWPVKIEVVNEISPKPSGPRGSKPGKDNVGDVAFLWTSLDEQPGWNDTVAGDLQELSGNVLAELDSKAYGYLKGVSSTVPTIMLNREFREWSAYKRAIARRVSDASLAIRQERYGLAVGAVLANLHANERKLRSQHDAWEERPRGKAEPDQPMTQQQFHRAIAEAARGVILLMPDFDELLGDLGRPDR